MRKGRKEEEEESHIRCLFPPLLPTQHIRVLRGCVWVTLVDDHHHHSRDGDHDQSMHCIDHRWWDDGAWCRWCRCSRLMTTWWWCYGWTNGHVTRYTCTVANRWWTNRRLCVIGTQGTHIATAIRVRLLNNYSHRYYHLLRIRWWSILCMTIMVRLYYLT